MWAQKSRHKRKFWPKKLPKEDPLRPGVEELPLLDEDTLPQEEDEEEEEEQEDEE